MTSLGPREQQLRAMREMKAVRGARSTTKPALPAKPKETTMFDTEAAGEKPDPAPPRKRERKAAAKKKAAKKMKKPPAKKAKPKAAKASVDGRPELRPGSKLATIDQMLRHPGGCTRAEVMAACDWPSVSMQQQAAALGVELKSSKEKGQPTRYWVD